MLHEGSWTWLQARITAPVRSRLYHSTVEGHYNPSMSLDLYLAFSCMPCACAGRHVPRCQRRPCQGTLAKRGRGEWTVGCILEGSGGCRHQVEGGYGWVWAVLQLAVLGSCNLLSHPLRFSLGRGSGGSLTRSSALLHPRCAVPRSVALRAACSPNLTGHTRRWFLLRQDAGVTLVLCAAPCTLLMACCASPTLVPP